MGSEDLVQRRIELLQGYSDTDTDASGRAWRDLRQRIKPQRQVKVDVSKFSKEQAAGAESVADVSRNRTCQTIDTTTGLKLGSVAYAEMRAR
jgi:hypothetical protein